MHLIVSNATQIVQAEINRNEFIAVRKSTIEDAERGYITMFTLSMQTLITKLGLVISLIVISPKMRTGTYLGSLDYLADKILKNKSMKAFLKATLINENANKVKHTLSSNSEISIKDTVYHYNRLVEELESTLKLSILQRLKISYVSSQRQQTQINQPKPSLLFDDQSHKKNTLLGDYRMTLILSPFASIDKYSKTARIDLRIERPKTYKFNFQMEVISRHSQRSILNKIMSINHGQPVTVSLDLKSEDIVNNYANLQVKLQLIMKHQKVEQPMTYVMLSTNIIPKK